MEFFARGLYGGLVGAVLMWGMFFLFCRYYLKTLLIDMTVRNPQFGLLLKSLVEQGMDRVVKAFKVKMPMISMFLSSGKEAQLKQVAIDELLDMAPKTPPEVFETAAAIIQAKVTPWIVLAGFLTGIAAAVWRF